MTLTYFERIDAKTAKHLIQSQCPQWQHLPIRPISSTSTSNTLFRLGDSLVIRLPERGDSAGILKEQTWLPFVAPHISLATPVPEYSGKPDIEFAQHWSVLKWLPGADLDQQPLINHQLAGQDLGQLYNELQDIPVTEHPGNGKHNSFRGGPLAQLDKRVRACIEECGNRIDQRSVTFFWQRALDQPLAEKQRWIHADLHPTNLLADKDRLTAVIDFGLLGVGDPACDLMTAWTILDSQGRQTLQSCTHATPDL